MGTIEFFFKNKITKIIEEKVVNKEQKNEILLEEDTSIESVLDGIEPEKKQEKDEGTEDEKPAITEVKIHYYNQIRKFAKMN